MSTSQVVISGLCMSTATACLFNKILPKEGFLIAKNSQGTNGNAIITGVLPWQLIFCEHFELNEKHLWRALSELHSVILGWYRCKTSKAANAAHISLLDRNIHKKLEDKLQARSLIFATFQKKLHYKDANLAGATFVRGSFFRIHSTDDSTQNCHHNWTELTVSVENLGDTSATGGTFTGDEPSPTAVNSAASQGYIDVYNTTALNDQLRSSAHSLPPDPFASVFQYLDGWNFNIQHALEKRYSQFIQKMSEATELYHRLETLKSTERNRSSGVREETPPHPVNSLYASFDYRSGANVSLPAYNMDAVSEPLVPTEQPAGLHSPPNNVHTPSCRAPVMSVSRSDGLAVRLMPNSPPRSDRRPLVTNPSPAPTYHTKVVSSTMPISLPQTYIPIDNRSIPPMQLQGSNRPESSPTSSTLSSNMAQDAYGNIYSPTVPARQRRLQ